MLNLFFLVNNILSKKLKDIRNFANFKKYVTDHIGYVTSNISGKYILQVTYSAKYPFATFLMQQNIPTLKICY